MGATPNIPPSQHLASGERHYEIIIFDTSKKPWKILSKTLFLKMNAKGVFWEQGAADAKQFKKRMRALCAHGRRENAAPVLKALCLYDKKIIITSIIFL